MIKIDACIYSEWAVLRLRTHQATAQSTKERSGTAAEPPTCFEGVRSSLGLDRCTTLVSPSQFGQKEEPDEHEVLEDHEQTECRSPVGSLIYITSPGAPFSLVETDNVGNIDSTIGHSFPFDVLIERDQKREHESGNAYGRCGN